MCSDRGGRRCGGQALVELLVAALALVPLYFGIAWLGKVLDAQQATISAARSLAFECTVRPGACSEADGQDLLAAETRRRFFSSHRFGLRSDDAAGGVPMPGERRALWTERSGAPLLERYEDVTVSVAPARFDSPLAFAGGVGGRAVRDAVGLLSEVAGPGRFGLPIDGGLVDARVDATLSRSRGAGDWLVRLIGMPVALQAHLTLLTDAWNASGPRGDADSVETRVLAGARPPAVDAAIEAAWWPARGLLSVASALGLEPAADAFRWHEVDMDRVPPDRLGVPEPEFPSVPVRADGP